MVLQILLLAAGLILILMGANWLVDGSSSIARKTGMSEFVIGLTIVGIGTSTPEMVVSFISAFQGKSEMALGNVIGSNIFNLLFILGTTTTITPIRNIDLSTILVDSVLLLGFTQLMLVFSQKESRFQKHQGAASVMCYVVYLAYIILRQFTTIF